MDLYEKLLAEVTESGIDVYEVDMHPKVKGLYADGVIWINKKLSRAEKAAVLAEEFGHHKKTVGNILDQKQINNRKQELLARTWAFETLMPLASIIEAYKNGVQSRYELSEYLGLPELFIEQAIKRYQQKYGTHVKVGKYTIIFTPFFGILEMFDFLEEGQALGQLP